MGLKLEDAMEIVKFSTTRSAIPEPLRVAHIIAAGIVTGESKGKCLKLRFLIRIYLIDYQGCVPHQKPYFNCRYI